MFRIATLFAALSFSASVVAGPVDFNGGVMTDKSGRTLYTFDKDQPGKSNCSGGCLAAWPAFGAKPTAGNDGALTVITREDGSKQWAYKNMPLYYYAGDAATGERNGDASGGVWHIVTQAEKTSAPAASSSGYGY
jgi:predicted lipoprotein with Yx(FWY)xxD motif